LTIDDVLKIIPYGHYTLGVLRRKGAIRGDISLPHFGATITVIYIIYYHTYY